MTPETKNLIDVLIRGMSFTVSELKKLQMDQKKFLQCSETMKKCESTGEPPLKRGARGS